MHLRSWLVLVSLFLLGPAWAGEAQPLEPLGVWTSQPGESETAFVLRVAATVYPYTAGHGVEVCGTLLRSTDGQRLRLAMFTDHSQVACRSPVLAQAGFEVGTPRLTLHTHPRRPSFQPNAQDMALLSAYAANPRLRYPVDGDRFSDRDFANGPGYVVASGRAPFGRPHLLFESGPNQVTELGRLPTLTAAQQRPDEGYQPDGLAQLAESALLAAPALSVRSP